MTECLHFATEGKCVGRSWGERYASERDIAEQYAALIACFSSHLEELTCAGEPVVCPDQQQTIEQTCDCEGCM